MRSDDVVVFDNSSGMLTLITHANPQEAGAYETACERLDDILDDLSAMEPSAFYPTEYEPITEADYQYSLENAFKTAVKDVKEHIQAGDVMQTVLSQFLSRMPKSLSLYRALRVLNPSPYMYFLNLMTHILSAHRQRYLRAWRMAMYRCAPSWALTTGKHKKQMWRSKTS